MTWLVLGFIVILAPGHKIGQNFENHWHHCKESRLFQMSRLRVDFKVNLLLQVDQDHFSQSELFAEKRTISFFLLYWAWAMILSIAIPNPKVINIFLSKINHRCLHQPFSRFPQPTTTIHFVLIYVGLTQLSPLSLSEMYDKHNLKYYNDPS